MVTLALNFYRVLSFLAYLIITTVSNFLVWCLQTDVTTLNIVRLTSWELLRPFLQRCANECNNSQQCWVLECIVGRIQPIRLWRLFVTMCMTMCIAGARGFSANGSNIVALRFGDHRTKEMLGVVGSKV